jgi:hypothetical protein
LRVSCEGSVEVTVMVKRSSWYSDAKWREAGDFVSYKRILKWVSSVGFHVRVSVLRHRVSVLYGLPTFRMNLLLPSSGSKSKQSNKLGFLPHYSHFPIHSSQSVQYSNLNSTIDEASLNMLRPSLWRKAKRNLEFPVLRREVASESTLFLCY